MAEPLSEKVTIDAASSGRATKSITDNTQDGADTKRLAAITRKIDWHIVPLMFLCYFLQFLDKVIINYSAVMGLQKDLHLHGNEFAWLPTAFAIAYALGELPQGCLIQRYPVSKVLGLNVVLWGVTLCCTAAAHNYAGILAARIALGCLEAAIAPALIMITTHWYTRAQATVRMGFWYCGLGIGQIVGGIISFAAQSAAKTGGFAGWRTMFLAVGVFNMAVGFVVLFWMTSTIQTADTFLSDEEKYLLQSALLTDQAGNGKKIFSKTGLLEAFTDLQVWLLFLSTILNLIPSGFISTFSATVIHNVGFTSKQAALLNIPSGLVSILATLLATSAILYNLPRWLSLCLLMLPTLLGACLMSFNAQNRASSLAGIYLINFVAAGLPLIYALAGANVQGYTKKVTTNAFIQVGFSIANIIGPQTFQARDAPDYIPAKVTVLAVSSATIAVSFALRVLYGMRNRRTSAARRMGQEAYVRDRVILTVEENEDSILTDRSRAAFRYVY